MTDKKVTKELQEKFMEYQLLEKQLEQLHKQAEQVAAQEAEVSVVLEHLEHMHSLDASGDQELLVPVANGIFFRARLADKDTVLVNVGAEVIVEKSFTEVIAMIKEQEKNVKDIRAGIEQQETALHEHMRVAEEELRHALDL